MIKTWLTIGLIGISGILFQDTIRFTGVVLNRDSFEPITNTTVLNMSRGGGAVSDSLGFFVIEALPGDTLLFSDVRFETSTFIVPEVLDQQDYGIIQLLVEKERLLEEVTIFPFPSEDEFKKAFMAVEPKPDLSSRALDAKRDLMQTLRETYENDKYYYEAWANRRIYELTGEIPPNNFLDPFRWTQFIRSFKKEK